jgi:hypothetical protein
VDAETGEIITGSGQGRAITTKTSGRSQQWFFLKDIEILDLEDVTSAWKTLSSMRE